MGNCVHSIQHRLELYQRKAEEAQERKIDIHQKAAEDEVIARLVDLEKAMLTASKNIKQQTVDINHIQGQPGLSDEDKTDLLFTPMAAKKAEQKKMKELQKRYTKALVRRDQVYNTERNVKDVRSDGRIGVQMKHMGHVAEKAIHDLDVNADINEKMQEMAEALEETNDSATTEENKFSRDDVMKDVTELLTRSQKPAASAAMNVAKPASVGTKLTVPKAAATKYTSLDLRNSRGLVQMTS